MSSTAMAVPAKESKLWACIKEVFVSTAEAKTWQIFAELGGRVIANALGFHGEAAKAFAAGVASSLVGFAQTLSNINSGKATGWDLFPAITRTASDIALAMEDATRKDAPSLLGRAIESRFPGVKFLAGKFFWPYTIATAIYDWLAPLIPCLLKDPEVPDTEPAVNAASPLVIDLNGDGVGSYKLKNGVYFDLDNNGFKEKTAWAHYQDGLLALDLNGNGTIDNGAELFGNHTQLANGSLAANGFEALAQYDDNGDGIINSKDKVWKKLLVWQDKVNDGVSQTDELTKIAKIGITEIDLGYKNSIFNAVNDTIFVFQAA